MTGMYSLFSSNHICSGKDNVQIVNSSLSSIDSIGCFPLTSSLHLSFVFLVRNFELNLVYVSHITKVLNCSVISFRSLYFQELKATKAIVKGQVPWMDVHTLHHNSVDTITSYLFLFPK